MGPFLLPIRQKIQQDALRVSLTLLLELRLVLAIVFSKLPMRQKKSEVRTCWWHCSRLHLQKGSGKDHTNKSEIKKDLTAAR